jgi:hypothetical protein
MNPFQKKKELNRAPTRLPYRGLKVTPQNRWKLVREMQIDGQDPEIALAYSKRMVRQEIAHYKAWLKGKTEFKFGMTTDEKTGEEIPNILLVL